MSTFALDKNYQQFNFEEISVEELQIISGGSGGGGSELLIGGAMVSFGGIGYGAALARGATMGARVGMFGGFAGAIGGAIIGGVVGVGAVAAGNYFG